MTVSNTGSVTAAMDDVKMKGGGGKRFLFERYYERAVEKARGRDWGVEGIDIEREAALIALTEVLEGLEAGKYPDLHNRDELWRLLSRITIRRCSNQRRLWTTKRRGSGHVGNEEGEAFSQISGSDRTPDQLAEWRDTYNQLLKVLENHEREVVELKYEGFGSAEIAELLGVTPRTVQRYIQSVRRKATKLFPEYRKGEDRSEP